MFSQEKMTMFLCVLGWHAPPQHHTPHTTASRCLFFHLFTSTCKRPFLSLVLFSGRHKGDSPKLSLSNTTGEGSQEPSDHGNFQQGAQRHPNMAATPSSRLAWAWLSLLILEIVNLTRGKVASLTTQFKA